MSKHVLCTDLAQWAGQKMHNFSLDMIIPLLMKHTDLTGYLFTILLITAKLVTKYWLNPNIPMHETQILCQKSD